MVMDAASGAVLAQAGYYKDGTTRRMVSDESSPFTWHFMGASTMKPLVVAGALQERRVSDSELFDTGNGTLTFNGQTYREWKEGGLGKVTLTDLIVKSSNLGVILVAQRLGAERLAAFLNRLGYQVAPNAPLADLSYGNYSGVSITAHQLAYAYAALVNGGREPRTGEVVVRSDVSDFIRKTLIRAVEEGTGTEARCKKFVAGGKTGTSIREVDGARTGTAYFVGFAPADSPRIVISVIVDDMGSEVNGNRHAAPLFREIVEGGLPLLEKAAPAK